MALENHKSITGIDVHQPNAFQYANATARLAATGFVAVDVKKWALDLDTYKYFVLTNHSPITWSSVT